MNSSKIIISRLISYKRNKIWYLDQNRIKFLITLKNMFPKVPSKSFQKLSNLKKVYWPRWHDTQNIFKWMIPPMIYNIIRRTKLLLSWMLENFWEIMSLPVPPRFTQISCTWYQNTACQIIHDPGNRHHWCLGKKNITISPLLLGCRGTRGLIYIHHISGI